MGYEWADEKEDVVVVAVAQLRDRRAGVRKNRLFEGPLMAEQACRARRIIIRRGGGGGRSESSRANHLHCLGCALLRHPSRQVHPVGRLALAQAD